MAWTLGQPGEVELGDIPFVVLPVLLQLVSTAVFSLIKQKTVLGKLEADPPHSKILRIFMLVVKLTCARPRRVSGSCVLWGTHFRLGLRICGLADTPQVRVPLTALQGGLAQRQRTERELPWKSCFENCVFKILSLFCFKNMLLDAYRKRADGNSFIYFF